MMKTSCLLLLSFFLAIEADYIDPITNANERGNFILNLVHVSDHHSHLQESTKKIALETVNKNARTIHYGGYARIVRLMRQAKNKWVNVIKIHAGDALVGTGFYRLFGTDPDLDMMHQVCYDIFNLGNHEFDDGDAVLADFLKQLTDISSPCQNTRVLSANLQAGPRSPLFPLQHYGYIAPHVIRNFPGGHKVAFIGVDIRNKTLSGSQPDRGTTLTDERTAIRQQIRLLERVGINKIVLVSHLGIAKDRNWMTRIEGVDVVIGAHSHTLMAKDVDLLKPNSRYPNIVQQRSSGKPICIGHAWKFGHGMGRMKVEFDSNGDVVTCAGDFFVPFETSPQASPMDAAIMTQYLQGLGPTFVRTRQDRKTLRTLKYYTDQMHGKQLFDTVLVKQVEPLCNEAIPGEGRSDLCTRKETAAHGGMACQLVAQAMLNQTWEADVAIHNAGGCMADIAAGNFTYGQAMELLPYSDTLVVLNMTGWQILLVLEQAMEVALGEGDESSGSYPYASGLRFGVNASEAMGYRISHLQLNARLAEGTWNDIELDTNYMVVTNSFLAAGRDGYLEFANVTSRQDMAETNLGAFISYVEELQAIASPDPEVVSTHVFEGQAGADDSAEDESQLLDGFFEGIQDGQQSTFSSESLDTASSNDESDVEDNSTSSSQLTPDETHEKDQDSADLSSIYNNDYSPKAHVRSSSIRPAAIGACLTLVGTALLTCSLSAWL